MSVTAVDLAKQLAMDPKVLRGRLRAWAAQGHPLLGGHQHRDAWIFSDAEAEELRRQLRAGTWRGALPSTTAAPAVQSGPRGPASEAVPTHRAPVAGSDQVVQVLLGPPMDVARVLLPDGPGLYAWWAPVALVPGLTQVPTKGVHPGRADLELLYIGIGSSLSARVRTHLGSSTGRSTLRRALGAWLGAEQGWRPVIRGDRLQHDELSEAALSAWMTRHLLLTWAEHPVPRDVEAAVIAALAPPLNHDHNHAHPNWRELDARRRAWRAAGA